MMVIGLIGLVGSGKDTVSEYLISKYGYKMVGMGDIVRELATKLGRSHNRDDLQRTQKEYRERYGDEYFGSLVVEKIKKSGWEKVIINGIRIPPDVEVPKKEFGRQMTVLLVDARPEIRFERLRSRKRVGDPETFEEFQRQENNELKLFNFDGVLKYVEKRVDNNGTLEHLHKNVDKFIKEIGGGR